MKLSLLILLSFLVFGVSAQKPKEIIRSVYFGGGSWYIDPTQIGDLKNVVDGIPNLAYYEISVTSHTDNIGGREFNQYLSRMRSQAVIDELLEMKVPQDQIKYRDFGQTEPVFDNQTNEGRMRNRRVDVIFTPLVF